MGEEKNGEEEGRWEDMDLDLLHIDPSSFNGNIHQLKKGVFSNWLWRNFLTWTILLD